MLHGGSLGDGASLADNMWRRKLLNPATRMKMTAVAGFSAARSEEQLLLADSVLPASKEEQPGITSHDFKSMERTENGATGVLAQEEPWAPTRAPNDIVNIENYNNYHCSIVPDMTIDAVD